MDNRYYDELAKCAGSFEHFCKYIKVNNPVNGPVPFILHDFQKRYISCLQGNRFVIATKFRQGGFTTTTIAYLLWKFLFDQKKSMMLTSRTDREAIAAGEIFKKMIETLPDWLQPVCSTDNQHQKTSVETGCKIFFNTPEASIGRRLDILFVDEAAFINKMDSHWKSLFPTIANGGRAIIISTVNSDSGWFYETYQSAKNGLNDFVVFKAEYTELKEWDDEKIATLRKNLGELGFKQEMEQQFLPSGEMFICDNPNAEKEMLEGMGSCTKHVPEWKEDDEMAPFRDKGEHNSDHSEFVSTDGDKPDLEELAKECQAAMYEQPVIRPNPPKEDAMDEVFKRFNMKKGSDIKNINKEPKLLYECELKGGCRDKEPEGVRAKMEKVDQIDLRKDRGYSFKCANMNDLAKAFPELTPDKISRVSHPHVNEEFEMTSKNLAEWMEALYGVDDPTAKYWRDAYDRQERKLEELEAKVHGVFPADMLRMAGVISKKEAQDIEKEASTGKGDVLQAIVKDSRFPKSLKLSFGDYLEVNGVPTLITTNSVKNAYMGLAALWNHDKAVEFVSNIVKEKLDVLFGFGKG